MKDFNCTVTSTWTNNEDDREFHTWRARGSGVCKKQLDHIMGPKYIRSTTWYLHQVRLRTWDHFPVITRIEGPELKTKKRVKGWARWTPVSEAEKAKFQEAVLCPRCDHGETAPRGAEDDDDEGLVQIVNLRKPGRWHLTQRSAGTLRGKTIAQGRP